MTNSYSSWFDSVYPLLTGNGIWLRSLLQSQNRRINDYSLLICRLSTYFDTQASFSHSVLYSLATEIPGIQPDIGFLVPSHDISLFEKDAIPWILGIHSKQGPYGFDCIAFSNATVLELLNLCTMLTKSNIPLKKSQRLSDNSVPLLLLGGSNAAASSLLWTNDPPVDGIFVGDDRTTIVSLFRTCRDAKQNRISKHELLTMLCAYDGFFEPEKKPLFTKKRIHLPIPASFSYTEQPAVSQAEYCGVASIVISNGCPFSCNFCFESWTHKPYHEASVDDIITQAKRMKAHLGLNALEVSSYNFNTHSSIFEILHELGIVVQSLGLKSQRFDLLAKDPNFLSCLIGLGKNSLTLGIEGISERIRNYLHKELDQQTLFVSIQRILSCQIRELKFFLIITGHEQAEDFEQFLELIRFIRSINKKEDKHVRIIFSVTPLVRFPHTPLEFEDAVMPNVYASILHTLSHAVCSHYFEFRCAYSLEEYLIAQLCVRASDQTILDGIIETCNATGFVYYRGISPEFMREFLHWCDSHALVLPSVLQGHTLSQRELKPWNGMNLNVSKDLLYERWIESHCALKKHTPAHPSNTPFEYKPSTQSATYSSILKTKTAQKKLGDEKVFLYVSIHKNLRGIDRKQAACALAAALVQLKPAFITGYRGYDTSYWGKQRHAEWLFGDDIVSIAWEKKSAQDLLSLMHDTELIHNTNTKIGHLVSLIKAVDKDFYQHITSKTFTFSSFYPSRIDSYLMQKSLKHTRIKQNDQSYSYKFSDAAIRKHSIISLSVAYEEQTRNTLVSITAHEKFDPIDFMKHAFEFPQPEYWTSVITEVRFAGANTP